MSNSYLSKIQDFIKNPHIRRYFESVLTFSTPVNGVNATAVLTFTGNVADGETVTIGSEIYEFDTNSVVTAGNIAVDVSGGVTAAQAVTALVAAITGNASSLFNAVDGAGDTVVITAKTKGTAGNVATTETCTNASWGAATATGGVNGTVGTAGDMKLDSNYMYLLIADNTISDANWLQIKLDTTAFTSVNIDNVTNPEILLKENGNTKWRIFSNSADSDKLVIYNDDGTENAIEIDSNSNVKISDNMGFGVTPTVWNAGYRAAEGTHSGVAFSTTDGILRLYSNCKFVSGAGEIYSKTGEAASQIYMYQGVIYFLTAPAGNAGDPVTFTERFKISSSGLDVANGATGTFTTTDGKTVTVTDGIITSIV